MAKLITKNEQSISWKELAEGVKAGKIALQQGDTVELKLTTGEIVFMQAVKVSEDGKRVTFVSKDCLATEMPMNEERTNYGGWAESDLRKRLNTEVFNTLPEELKEVIATTKRRQYVDGKIVECEDKLWIPSEYEIHGREIFAEHVEGNARTCSSDRDCAENVFKMDVQHHGRKAGGICGRRSGRRNREDPRGRDNSMKLEEMIAVIQNPDSRKSPDCRSNR